jgi:hypothetical protein
MKIKFILLQTLYVFMIVFGLFLGFGGTLNYLDNKDTLLKWIVGEIILGILPIFFGVLLLTKIRKKIKSLDKDDLENKIFQLASKSCARLTIADVSMNTNLTTAESKKILDEFCLNGFAEILVSDSGVIVYYFKNIINEQEKMSSEKI